MAISGMGSQKNDEPRLEFDNAIVFPGLINSHEHLDFNLFPKLGHANYNSYREWGEDIHKTNRSVIEDVLRIPKALRTQWGLYKNLIAGVTTVVNHGSHLSVQDPLIEVCQQYPCIHSVAFDKTWKWKLNRPRFSNPLPYVMHLGEGTDQKSYEEINAVIRWNLLRKNIIAVHGVAMQPEQARHFKALVWCADSNFFLLSKTAAVEQLKDRLPVVIGTDSTLTADWNIWKQLRIAAATGKMSPAEIFDAVTSTPARIWGLDNIGKIEPGFQADIVVADRGAGKGIESFCQVDPARILLVLKAGKIILFDESIASQVSLPGIDVSGFTRFSIENRRKHCLGDLSTVVQEIRNYYPGVSLPVEIEL
jgi:cytosine/adenosine deaminase-related metal-dependent hydrolase